MSTMVKITNKNVQDSTTPINIVVVTTRALGIKVQLGCSA